MDPITGEGLYFAIKSGMEAANAILSDPEKIRPAFLKRTAPVAKIIRRDERLKRFFFRGGTQRLFRKVVSGKDRFAGFYCDHQVSAYDYPHFLKLCLEYKKQKKAKKKK